MRCNPNLQITIQSLFYPFLCAFSSFCVFLHKDPAEMARGQDEGGGRLTKIVLSRDNLASGLYFIRLIENNKTLAVDKLLITDK